MTALGSWRDRKRKGQRKRNRRQENKKTQTVKNVLLMFKYM